MTTNPTIKAAIRERMKKTGEPYVVARRFVMEQERPRTIPSVIPGSVSPQAYAVPNKPLNAIVGQKTITIMGAIGGVGKTVTAVCLAGAIANGFSESNKPKKVVIVDLNTQDGTVGSLIGQDLPTALSIRARNIWNAETVSENLVHDKSLGVEALLAPVRVHRAEDLSPAFYQSVIEILQTTHDVVILNCPSNYLDPLSRLAFDLSDEILLVTTLANTSVVGMGRALTELLADTSVGGLNIPKSKIGIVANMVINNVGMGKDKLLRAALGTPLIGQIPAEYDTVLVAINQNRLSDLLKHPRLGPAYTKLARMCLPNITDTPRRKGEALLVGLDDSRGNVYWTPNEHSHLLVGGKQGSGKTYFLQSLFKQIAEADSLIAAVSLNQKALSENTKIWHEASDPKSALVVISEIEELMQSRYTLMQRAGVKHYNQLPGTPAVFLMIDEIDSLIDDGDVAKVKITLHLGSIARLGRAAGIHMIITAKHPEVIPDTLRVQLDARLALGQMSEAYYEALTELDSDYHLSSWDTDSPFPLMSAKQFGEGVLRLGNNAIKITTPTV